MGSPRASRAWVGFQDPQGDRDATARPATRLGTRDHPTVAVDLSLWQRPFL